jgi:MraZ protein
MTLFIGTHQNKLDAKRRVSIPAQFRSVLKKNSHAGEAAAVATVYLRPSHQQPCIEGWTEFGFEALSEPVAQAYNLFSPEHEDFVMALFGDACALETDKEGRIMLPDAMIAHAGISDAVTFIGTRNNFQIWEPAAGAKRLAEAREKARTAGFTLRPQVPA